MEVIIQYIFETGQVLTVRETHELMHFEEEESFSTMFDRKSGTRPNSCSHTAPAQPCCFDCMTYRHVIHFGLIAAVGRFVYAKTNSCFTPSAFITEGMDIIYTTILWLRCFAEEA